MWRLIGEDEGRERDWVVHNLKMKERAVIFFWESFLNKKVEGAPLKRKLMTVLT